VGEIRFNGNKNAVISFVNPTLHIGSSPRYDTAADNDRYGTLLQSFEQIPADLISREVTAVEVYFYAYRNTGSNNGVNIDFLEATFDPSNVTAANCPPRTSSDIRSVTNYGLPAYVRFLSLYVTAMTSPNEIHKIGLTAKYGLSISTYGYCVYTDSGQYPPYIEVSYGDKYLTDQLAVRWPSTSERLQITKDIDFSWTYLQQNTLFRVDQTSATFYWRVPGSAAVTSIPLATETSLVIPAGTFPEGEIEWRIVATSTSGQTSETVWRKNETVGLTISSASPQNGYVPRDTDTVFTWLLDFVAEYGSPVQSSATFRYIVDDSSEMAEIEINGNAQTITIPAGTFSGDRVKWQVTSRTAEGFSATSEWYELSTVEPASTVGALAPDNIVLDGAETVVFQWEHQISTGTQPTAFDLQMSSDGVSWSTFRSMQTSETSILIPVTSLPTGNVYWRVRTYNSDNVPSAWSAAAHIVIVAAPAAPSIAITSSAPQFSVRWSQQGQMCYEMRLDGAVIERRHSTESFYTYSGYLSSGTYLLEIRIQNQLGLWSDWAAASLPIVNVDGPAILLTASGSHVVSLSWGTSGAYDNYLVYRNGVQIGQTSGNGYIDQWALGHAVYQVRGVYRDTGYFTASPCVELIAAVDTMMISSVDNPKWIRLDLSMSKLRSTSMQTRRNVTYTHYVGAHLPSADVGDAVDQTYSLDCAWKVEQMQDALAFEQLCGSLVCIKTPSGRRIVGILNDISCTESKLIVSYSATITPVHWEEFSK